MTREQRDALLLGDRNGTSGGTPALPEAFRAVLAHLYENGTSTTRTLHKIIREQDVVAFKDRRILEVWGTWEDFCAAILGVLSDGGFISVSLSEDGWDITPKATPGKELLILRVVDDSGDRRVRIKFHSESERQQRNDMQVVINDIDTLLTKVNRMRNDHPVYEKIAQYQAASSRLLRETLNGEQVPENIQEETEGIFQRRPRQRKRPEMRRGGVVRDWVFSYMREHSMQLLSIQQIAEAFDEHDADNIRAGRFGKVNTGTIVARLRDLNRTDPGKIEWFEPPQVRRVSVMYVPEEQEDALYVPLG